jgi:hypothetical protein
MRAPRSLHAVRQNAGKFGQFEGCGMSTRRAAPAGMTWIAILVATVFDSLRMLCHMVAAVLLQLGCDRSGSD